MRRPSCRVVVWWALSATAAVAVAQTAPAQPAQPAKVSLQFADVPLGEAAAQLGKQLDTLILIDPEVTGKVTLTAEVPREAALQVFASAVQAMARRVIIFCTAEEARGPAEAPLPPEVMGAWPEGTRLRDVAADLSQQTERRVLCTAAVADLPVALATATDLKQALDAVAEKAGCRWVRGWQITPLDPAVVAKAFDAFGAVPPEQRQAMAEGALDQILGEWRKLPPGQRKEAVQRFARLVETFAQKLATSDEGTRQTFKANATPLIQQAVKRFVTLDAQEQAELMPAIQALSKLR